MARTLRVLTINEFKELVGSSTIHIKLSQKSGSYYATDAKLNRVASVAPEVMEAIAAQVPLVVLELEDLGDRWFLIVPQRDSSPDVAVL